MYLYRKTSLHRKAEQAVLLAAAVVVLSLPLAAQYRVPQPERKTPRAVAVLETFKNGSRRLLPVTFFYETHFYDANFYHATPVPFTLYSETVYEVQQFGKPLGTFTVQSASENSAEWFGNGRFKVAPDAATLAKKRAPRAMVVEDPSRPVLHRHEGSEGDNPAPHPAATASAPEADDDPDRPKLHRREGSDSTPAKTSTQAPAAGQDSASAQAPTQASAQTPAAQSGSQTPASQPEESSGQDPNRPKLHRKDDSSAGKGSTPATPPPSSQPATPSSGQSPSQPASQSASLTVNAPAELTPSDDPDHPILRRGQPVQEQSGHDLPDFKLEEPITRQVAVSDAGRSEVQPLIYVCHEEERQQMEESARELARAELRRVAAQRGLVLPTPANTAAVKTASSKKAAAAKAVELPELKLDDEQFVPYDLDYNNYATVVYSARYAPVSPSASASGIGVHGKGWVVTVVARQDESRLVKLYSAVSDPRELDLYPEVRLVDAVDPDGYGRMALLFREQKRDGVSWLLGRPTGYELQTVFETSR